MLARKAIIRDNLQMRDTSSKVIKYDYYFNGQVIKTIDLGVKDIHAVVKKVENFILIQNEQGLIILNGDQIKLFDFPTKSHIFSFQKPIVYGEDKIAFVLHANNVQGHLIGVYIGFIDFNTQEQKYYQSPDVRHIFGLAILDSEHVIFSRNDGISILDIETFEVEKPRHHSHSVGLLINESQVIIGGKRTITFWDRDTFNGIPFSLETVMDMKIVDDQKLVAITGNVIGLVNYKNRSVIKIMDLIALQTEQLINPLRKLIRDLTTLESRKEIMVRSTHSIFVFDYDLNLKRMFRFDNRILFTTLLPNDELMIIFDEFLQILNFYTFEVLSQNNNIYGRNNEFINGKLYKLNDDQLLIYE